MQNKFKDKNILITGGTGFIGSKLIDKLLSLNANIFLLTRQKNYKDYRNIKILYYDYKSLSKILNDFTFDFIFHLAAKVGYAHQESEVSEYIESNIALGSKLLEHLKENNLEGVFINTGTYWEHKNGSSQIDPLNLYASTKVAFYNILKYYGESFGIKSMTLKLFDVYSLSDTRKKLINLILEHKKLDVTEGTQKVDFVHIDDVIEAYISGATQAKSSAPKYSVSTGKPIQLKEIFSFFNNHPSQKYYLNIGARKSYIDIIQSPYCEDILPNWKATKNILNDIKEYLHE